VPQGRELLREASLARPWDVRTLCKPGAPVLCHWAAGGFGPLTFDLFCYFLNIFKSFESSKFVYDSFELRKL
jgi:hypothetical protein